jgi:hypothetical protein
VPFEKTSRLSNECNSFDKIHIVVKSGGSLRISPPRKMNSRGDSGKSEDTTARRTCDATGGVYFRGDVADGDACCRAARPLRSARIAQLLRRFGRHLLVIAWLQTNVNGRLQILIAAEVAQTFALDICRLLCLA